MTKLELRVLIGVLTVCLAVAAIGVAGYFLKFQIPADIPYVRPRGGLIFEYQGMIGGLIALVGAILVFVVTRQSLTAAERAYHLDRDRERDRNYIRATAYVSSEFRYVAIAMMENTKLTRESLAESRAQLITIVEFNIEIGLAVRNAIEEFASIVEAMAEAPDIEPSARRELRDGVAYRLYVTCCYLAALAHAIAGGKKQLGDRITINKASTEASAKRSGFVVGDIGYMANFVA